jgi:hypothetical protein
MAGHSRLKDGLASLAYARPSTFSLLKKEGRGCPHKAGHDEEI